MPVSVIHESTLVDVPTKLRELANTIESAPEVGYVHTCVVVVEAATTMVFGFGPRSTASECHVALHAGMTDLMKRTTSQS